MPLRDVTEDDLPILFEQQRDPEANGVAALPTRERDAFFAHWRTKVLADPRCRKKTIVVLGEVAGHILSWDAPGRRLVGYRIGRRFWGRGVATAALAELVREHETARPLHAFVAVENVGSIRVLEKCGFRRVGDPITGADGVAELLFELSS